MKLARNKNRCPARKREREEARGEASERVARLAEATGAAETKGVRAITWIVGYRHPEVALIEIMIGGPMVGAARQGGGRKGRSELGNERTWPSGSALSRKPSRRSGPIKRPPLSSSARQIAFYHFNSIFQYGRPTEPSSRAFLSIQPYSFFLSSSFVFASFTEWGRGTGLRKYQIFLKIYVHEEKCRLGFRSWMGERVFLEKMERW